MLSQSRFSAVFLALTVVWACGGSSTSDDAGAAGAPGAGTSAGVAGASAGRGGTSSAGGGGTSIAGRGGASAGAGGSGKVDCDPRKIVCKRVAPDCEGDQVPSVDGSCYGPCVEIDACGCTEAAACPEEERFTCHMNRQRCGPYVR